MGTETTGLVVHPKGEQPEIEVWSAVADTYGGRVHVEWDATAPVTPLGQLPFFIEYLKQGGLFDGWVARIARWCSPARTRRANATCWAPCCYRCWRGTGAMHTSRHCAAMRSIRRCSA